MIYNNRIATPSRTKQILNKYNFSFKKSLGQNFIVDVNILENMIQKSGITKRSGVIEIGPGIGALTEQLAIHAQKVVAYEIDQRLLPILSHTLSGYHNVQIIHEDILEANVVEMIQRQFKDITDIHIVANLPYYITTPILLKLLEDQLPISSITIMIQKEVAERMASKPNEKSYGSLTIAVQYYTTAEMIMDVPRTVFMPQPNVTSTVLKLTKHSEPPVKVHNEPYFFNIVRACFVHRRKTIRNNLISHFKNSFNQENITTILDQVNIDSKRRGESLSMVEFAKLANAFYEKDNRND